VQNLSQLGVVGALEHVEGDAAHELVARRKGGIGPSRGGSE
jgi:hypothetical protein